MKMIYSSLEPHSCLMQTEKTDKGLVVQSIFSWTSSLSVKYRYFFLLKKIWVVFAVLSLYRYEHAYLNLLYSQRQYIYDTLLFGTAHLSLSVVIYCWLWFLCFIYLHVLSKPVYDYLWIILPFISAEDSQICNVDIIWIMRVWIFFESVSKHCRSRLDCSSDLDRINPTSSSLKYSQIVQLPFQVF